MDRRMPAMMGAGGAALLALISLLAFTFAPMSVNAEDPDPPPPPSEDASCATPEERRFVVAAGLSQLGFQGGEYLGEGEFDLSLPGANQRGNGSFSDETVDSAQKLVAFLKGGSDAQKALRGGVLEGLPANEHDGIDDPNKWIGVQFLTDIGYEGNTLYAGGEVKPSGPITRDRGDIFFFYVGDDCKVYDNVGVRAGCANLQLAPPVPVREGQPTPQAPPPTGKPTPPAPTPSPPPAPAPPPAPPVTEPCPPRHTGTPPNCVKLPGTDGANEPNQPPAQQPPSNPDVNVGPTPHASPEPTLPPRGPEVWTPTTVPSVQGPIANDPPRTPTTGAPTPPPPGMF